MESVYIERTEGYFTSIKKKNRSKLEVQKPCVQLDVKYLLDVHVIIQ